MNSDRRVVGTGSSEEEDCDRIVLPSREACEVRKAAAYSTGPGLWRRDLQH
jgi:hypothetical protein